jgi:hypothetical protein
VFEQISHIRMARGSNPQDYCQEVGIKLDLV